MDTTNIYIDNGRASNTCRLTGGFAMFTAMTAIAIDRVGFGTREKSV